MSKTQTDSHPLSAPRLLTFASLFTSPVPIQFRAVCGALDLEPRRIKALQLIYRHFPAEMPRVMLLSDWFEILSHFLELVDAHWFAMDWASIHSLEEACYASQEWEHNRDEPTFRNEEESATKILTLLLEVIPFQGFSFEAELGNWSRVGQSPTLMMIRDTFRPNPTERPLGEIPDLVAGVNVTRKILPWLYLDDRDLPSVEVPLRWLPEVIRYVCAQTGNPFLDNHNTFTHWVENRWYHWDHDIDLLRGYLPQSRATLKKVKSFARWADQSETAAQEIGKWLALPTEALTAL